MKNKFKLPKGIACLLIILILFGYLASVMGLANMLNTIMHTAHDLLLNTVFYLMGICVVTGALSTIFVEFGVVDLLQKIFRPVMKPLFNLPGVASLGAVMTFLSDNPAIISLSKDKHFTKYFKKYQLISLTNFGTAFGMGLIVIVFMIGQGYFAAPLIGLVGAICGCIISTRFMQHYVCKDYPQYRLENALTDEEVKMLEAENRSNEDNEKKGSTFIRILNSLLDGGKSGVEIGLAIIPGVLIISTFVMMLTFGGSAEGVDEAGDAIMVYTGGAYEGTKLLPWLASKINFVFKWLFGFTAPELVAFPITALGAVGAALSLVPEFTSQGIIDGNAIAVFTAMGMCWSGYLSTHTAMLDSMGYRPLLSRAFLSHFFGGLGAGIVAHWLYVGIMALASLFGAKEVYSVEANQWSCTMEQETMNTVTMKAFDNGTFVIDSWYGEGCTESLQFTVNADNTVSITNAYASVEDKYFFVHINQKGAPGDPCYASVCPVDIWSQFDGDRNEGCFYCFVFVYDVYKRIIDKGYYEITWGGRERQTLYDQEAVEEVKLLEKAKAAEEALEEAQAVVDSLAAVQAATVSSDS